MFVALLLSSFLTSAHAVESDLTVEQLVNQTPAFKSLINAIQDSAGVDCQKFNASPIGIAEADFEKTGQPTKFKFSMPCALVGSSGSPPKMLNITYLVDGSGKDEVKKIFSEELVPIQQQ